MIHVSRMIITLSLGVLLFVLPCHATATEIISIEPPSWWAGHTLNPVRVMARGRELSAASVQSGDPNIMTSNVTVGASANTVFFDVYIATNVKPGVKTFSFSTPQGRALAKFEILHANPKSFKPQGFSSDDIVYLIMPDRFANGDASNDDPANSRGLFNRKQVRSYHGGDIQGIIDRLPYLKNLGVTAIWLTPVYENDHTLHEPTWFSTVGFTDYHGYSPINYYGLDEHFGSVKLFRELTDKAHALGLKVILDQVSNHTGLKHPWVKNPPTHAWYHGTADNHLKNTYQAWQTLNPHQSSETLSPVLDGWLDSTLPDLNQDDPEVSRYLIQNMLWWVGVGGLDALRLDAFNYVSPSYWAQGLKALKIEYPSFRAMGEIYSPDPDASFISAYQAGGRGVGGVDPGLDAVFDFPLRSASRQVFVEGKPISKLAESLSRDRLYPNPQMLITFFGLHDDPRFMGLEKSSVSALNLAFAFILTTRGVPLIYAGDEIGMPGGGEPDNRRDFPGGWKDDARNAFAVTGRTPAENEIWRFVSMLTRLRASSPALRQGRLVDLEVSENVYAYGRISKDDWAIVILNNSGEPQAVDLDATSVSVKPGISELHDELGGAAAKFVDGRIKVLLSPKSAAVYRAPVVR